MKISETGEILIPPDLQKKYGFTPGTEVIFTAESGDLVLSKAAALKSKEQRKAEIEQWLRKATGVGRSGMTTDDILRMTRGED